MMKIVFIIAILLSQFGFCSDIHKSLTKIISDDYASLDQYYADNVFFESQNGYFEHMFKIVSIDTVATELYIDANLTILEVRTILSEPLIVESKLVKILDTLVYSVVNYQNRNYRLFGFFLTDILIASNIIGNKFLEKFSKVLKNNQILTNRQCRIWKKNIIFDYTLHDKVGKPCELLRVYGDLIPDLKKRCLIRQYLPGLTI